MLLFYRVCLILTLSQSFISASSQSYHSDSVSRTILFEEFTGTWCGWCPGGHVILKNILKNNANIIPVVIHGGRGTEPMRTYYGDHLIEDMLIWFPTACIDRFTFPGNHVTQLANSNWVEKLHDRQQYPPKAKVSLEKSYESSTREISLTVNVEFLTSIKGAFRFNAYIVEDNVSGGDLYDQSNEFNNNPDYPDLYNKGNPIKGYIHQHVLRGMLGGPYGLNPEGELAIPEQVSSGQVYSYTFSDTLHENYKPEDINLVGYVLHFEDYHDSDVLNAASMPLLETAVADIVVQKEFIVYPNPGSGRLKIFLSSQQRNEIQIKITDLQARNVYSGKVTPISGSQIIPVDLTSLKSGVYILELICGSIRESQKIILRNN